MLLGCIELAIVQHLEAMSSKLRPIFEQMLDDIKARKENLERL
jgi:DNA invertase Pin-like site-specific DNA recombinase